VLAGLRAMEIDVETAPRLVRGLDYYTRTVFEVHDSSLGAQNAVGGGGRYDQLVEELGGSETPSIGFSIGMDRLFLATSEEHAEGAPAEPDAFVVARQPDATTDALRAARLLRRAPGIGEERPLRVMTDVQGRSASSQMKVASRTGAKYVVFVPAEAYGYAVRDMAAGRDEPKQADLNDLRDWLRERRRERDASKPRESA
jgi:histidyl-tRNA synthetase